MQSGSAALKKEKISQKIPSFGFFLKTENWKREGRSRKKPRSKRLLRDWC